MEKELDKDVENGYRCAICKSAYIGGPDTIEQEDGTLVHQSCYERAIQEDIINRTVRPIRRSA